MSSAPTVSVVIPAYRHQGFVEEAITSVLQQSFQDLELIVIDDGSPDETAAVAARAIAGDARARLLRQANAGSHATLNRGMSLARGEWIAILNSDDRFHRDRLTRLLTAADTRHDFLVTDLQMIDSNGAVVEDRGHWFNAMIDGFRQYARANGAVAGLLYGNYTASTSNFFFRRELLSKIGGFRDYRYVVDWDFALRAALHAPDRFAYLVDELLLDYRLHGSNTILAGALRGALEITAMHRGMLRSHYGVPRALWAAIHRNQRHLRRHWRELGEQRIEGFVRQREADLTLVRDALEKESAARTVEMEVRKREAEVRQQEVGLLQSQLRELHEELARTRQRAVDCEAQLNAIFASRSWRYTRFLRKR